MKRPGNMNAQARNGQAQAPAMHFGQRLAGSSQIFTGVLFAVFVAVLLIAIVVGTNVYRVLYVEGQQTSSERLATALLANIVRSNDTADAFAQGEGPEGPALMMREFTETGSFETRIYQYEGAIVQEYAQEGTALDPQRASVLEESDTFDFRLNDRLLTITTDNGTVDVALRAHGGGEA